MAIKKAGKTSEAKATKATGATTGSERTAAPVNIIGLTDNLIVQDFKNNEVLDNFMETAIKVRDDLPNKINIFKIDAGRYDLAYSFVGFGFKANGKAYMGLVLLEATGDQPLDSEAYLEEMSKNNGDDVGLVAADEFDEEVYSLARQLAAQEYKLAEKNIYMLHGVVVPHTADAEKTAVVAALYYHNLITSKYMIEEGKASDITIPVLMSGLGRGVVEAHLSYNMGTTISKFGRHIATDFNLETVFRESVVKGAGRRKKVRSKSLGMTTGYVDGIIFEETEPYTGMPVAKYRPLIVINELVTLAPTLNYGLLNLINALALARPTTLGSLLVEKDIGILNKFFCAGPENSCDPISLKEADIDTINQILFRHVAEPEFFLEVEINGDDYPYLYPFAGLANPDTAAQSTKDILQAVANLTGQAVTVSRVVDRTPILVPVGEFVDADNNVRDIREIDVLTIAKYGSREDMIDWMFSNTDPATCFSRTGKDPLTLKIEIINRITKIMGTKVYITGRAVRIPLAPEFLNALNDAAAAAGYRINFTDAVDTRLGVNDLQMLATTYSGVKVDPAIFSSPTYNAYRRPGFNPYI